MNEMDDSDGLTPARLRVLLAVASTGSFSAAAREVGTSQSGVSRSVAAVESILDTVVFDRSTRQVRLTDAGRDVVERAALVVAEIDAVVRQARSSEPPRPRLTVASLTSVSELHLADAVAGLEPPLRLMRCIEGLQAVVEHAVLSGQALVGIGDLADLPPELHGRPLWEETFRLAVPTGHRLSRRRRVTLSDIANEPLVGFSRDAELRTTIDRELADARQLRTPDYVVDRFRTALSLVAAGLGVMMVPAIVTAGGPSGLRFVDVDHPELRRTMGVFTATMTAAPAGLEPLLDRLVAALIDIPGVSAPLELR